MVVSDPTRALMLPGAIAGALALENDVLMIQSDNHPGTLAKIAERLSEAVVNIEYTYMAATLDSDKGLMILRPNDVDKALRALRQEDSRLGHSPPTGVTSGAPLCSKRGARWPSQAR